MTPPRNQHRPVIRFFRITFSYGSDTYTVIPLSPHPGVARNAFRLRKQSGDRQVYDVRVTKHGPECDCPGYTYRPCKHVAMLRAAHMLD